MGRFGVTGKSFEQQSYQIERALETFEILDGLREYADRVATRLHEVLLLGLPPRLSSVVRKLALAFLNLQCDDSRSGRIDSIASLCRDLRPSRMDTLYKDCAVVATETLHNFATALLPCVRPVLRSPVQGHERATWILLHKYLWELADTCSLILDEHKEAESAERRRAAADEDEDDWTLYDEWRNEDHEGELWEGDVDDDDDDNDDDEAEVVEEGETVEALAAFAADQQNVHTAPARSGVERVLDALLLAVGPRLLSLCDTLQIRLPREERLATFLERVCNDPPEELEEPIVRINAVGRPYRVNLVASYGGLARIALDLCLATPPYKQYGILHGLMAHISGGYHAESALRLGDLGDFLSGWMSELLPWQIVDSPDAYTAANWALYWNDSLLQTVHEAWTEALVALQNAWKPWTEVLEEAAWSEFRHDVDTVSNFGITYSELLMMVWGYAETQPADTRREIAVRLAEEVLDGLGMCEQGKMTRLANVLHGFHPALDDVVVLSVGEQLQNRMAVISRLPVEERRAAADAVFAELDIPVEEQGAWTEALGG